MTNTAITMTARCFGNVIIVSPLNQFLVFSVPETGKFEPCRPDFLDSRYETEDTAFFLVRWVPMFGPRNGEIKVHRDGCGWS